MHEVFLQPASPLPQNRLVCIQQLTILGVLYVIMDILRPRELILGLCSDAVTTVAIACRRIKWEIYY